VSVPSDIFGTAYLDAESFRAASELFGVGAALDDYPNTGDDAKISRVLQAASRAVDAFCGKVFTPADITETHPFNSDTWQLRINNPPVASVSACLIRYGISSTITIDISRLYINNQQGYIEISRDLQAASIITAQVMASLNTPIVEITYKSLQSVPAVVKLATGYQAAHMMNTGFVDKIVPANFGKVDMGGLSINNRKGARTSAEAQAASIAPEAARLLSPLVQMSVA
jgi:hypothetical protein